MDSKQRKIALAAVSFVWASFVIAHPGETEVHCAVARVGLIETKITYSFSTRLRHFLV